MFCCVMIHYVIGQIRTDRKEPVRFDSFQFLDFRKLIGSVRFGSARFGLVRTNTFPGSTRFGVFGRIVAPYGSVRFGSASGSGRFRN